MRRAKLMMSRVRPLLAAAAIVALTIGLARAQGPGRGNTNWPTTGADAQRTSWMRNEAKLAAESIARSGFQFLWKNKLENQPSQLNALTQPLLLQNIISHKGFKALAFVGGSADVVYAIDYDLNRVYWKQKLSTASPRAGATAACPGGLTTITRAAPIVPPATPAGRAAGAARGRGPAPPPPNRGGINPGSLPINSAVYALSSGGMLHFLNPHIGTDIQPPVRFLPLNAKAMGLIQIDNVLYTATSDNCGGAPNGVWALDLDSEAKTVTKWETRTSVAGTSGPTFGLDGNIYVAAGNAIQALQVKSLKPLGSFAAQSGFTTAPVVFTFENLDLLAAANSDNRVYLVNAKALAAGDQNALVARSPEYAAPVASAPQALATWEESNGTRWLLAPSRAGIAAFKVVEKNGAIALEPGWTSREIASPLPPTVLNDIVFAVASGLPSGDDKMPVAERIKRAGAAVLYALDARTGRELWNSGTTITTFSPGPAPAAGDSQVYVATHDGTLYAFGVPQER